MSKNFAELVVEMTNAINRGHVKTLEPPVGEEHDTDFVMKTFAREVSCPHTKGLAASA